MFYMLAVLLADQEARNYLKRKYTNLEKEFYEVFLGKTIVIPLQPNLNPVPERYHVVFVSNVS